MTDYDERGFASDRRVVRARLSHVIAMLSPLARGAGAIGDWRDAWLCCTLAIHELEAELCRILGDEAIRRRGLPALR
jgi:hypothetical protein